MSKLLTAERKANWGFIATFSLGIALTLCHFTILYWEKGSFAHCGAGYTQYGAVLWILLLLGVCGCIVLLAFIFRSFRQFAWIVLLLITIGGNVILLPSFDESSVNKCENIK